LIVTNAVILYRNDILITVQPYIIFPKGCDGADSRSTLVLPNHTIHTYSSTILHNSNLQLRFKTMRQRQEVQIRNFPCSARAIYCFTLLLPFLRSVLAQTEPDTTQTPILLRADNYKEHTNGKTVLLHFWDRNCEVCRDELKPVWNQLAEDWFQDPVGFIGEINCSHPRGQVICERFQVTSVPTILYGDPLAPQEYQGDFDYASLSAFAKEELNRPCCHVQHLESCDANTQNIISELRAKPVDELVLEKSKIDALLDHAWATTFSMTDYNDNVTRTEQETNYRWLLQILVEDHALPMEESRFIWPEDANEPDDNFLNEETYAATPDDEDWDENEDYTGYEEDISDEEDGDFTDDMWLEEANDFDDAFYDDLEAEIDDDEFWGQDEHEKDDDDEDDDDDNNVAFVDDDYVGTEDEDTQDKNDLEMGDEL
jgi:thiol-disulfide isomerase/thioredoxin